MEKVQDAFFFWFNLLPQLYSYLLLLYQEVMKSTRTQLERELVLEDVLAVKDLPSYTMLDK
jgi:hypothetical protein